MMNATLVTRQRRLLLKLMLSSIFNVLLCSQFAHAQQLEVDLGIDLANPDFLSEFNSSFEVGLSAGAPAMDERESVIVSAIQNLYQTSVDAALEFALNEVRQQERRIYRAQRYNWSSELDYVYSANVEYAIGQLYQLKGNRVQAEQYYFQALEKFPAYVSAYARLMEIYLNQEDCEKAIEAGRKAVAIGGANGNVFKGMGLCYLLENDYGAALSAFRIAKTFMPNDTGSNYYHAVSAVNMGYSGEAISILDELIVENPDAVNTYSLQVNAYLLEDDYDGALVTLDIARRKGLLNSSSYNLLGSIYINKEMPEAAAEAYGKSLEVGRPGPFTSAIDAFNYLSRFGEWQLAGDYLDKVATAYQGRLNQNEQRSLAVLQARVLMDSGQAADGAELLREVIQTDPMNGDALLSLANYYWQQQDFERADIYFQQAASVESVTLQALMANAQMATDREDWESGIELLRRASEYVPPESLSIVEENIRALERILNLTD